MRTNRMLASRLRDMCRRRALASKGLEPKHEHSAIPKDTTIIESSVRARALAGSGLNSMGMPLMGKANDNTASHDRHRVPNTTTHNMRGQTCLTRPDAV